MSLYVQGMSEFHCYILGIIITKSVVLTLISIKHFKKITCQRASTIVTLCQAEEAKEACARLKYSDSEIDQWLLTIVYDNHENLWGERR